ncbi:hypothetical protein MRB53_021269 [Persea americana]|uniref:Uncharacterized protein n=1 Tax=Persea americana TaxID=3435 RepID=A0ACC2L4F7_PERAE|nr:hypothetical protein MRB53_021269 [Persea americana]
MVQILQKCPNRKQAAVRYYNCVLRYSDWRFFSQVEVNQRQGLYNIQNISDPVRFDTLVRTLMENVSTTAAMNPSRIETGVTNYTQFASLYDIYPFYPASVNPIRVSIPSPPPPPVAATSPSNCGPDNSGRNAAEGNGMIASSSYLVFCYPTLL